MSVGKIEPFQLEVFFAKYEFVAEHLLCCSDAESYSLKDLLALADEDALRQWNNLHLGYTECKGLPELRKVCASEYDGLTAENILFFAGAEEAIFCVMHTLLQPSDHAIVITPCYQSLKSIPDTICDVSTMDLDLLDDWKLDCNALRALIKPGITKMIIMNFPHNPTGTIITAAQQQQLIEIAQEFDLWLFCDEVYRGIEREESFTIPQLATVYDKGISLGALSKVYGLAGLRIGWMACSDVAVIDAVSGNKHYLSICNSAPSELLGLIALKAKDAIFARTREIIRHNEEILLEFLQRHGALFTWCKPKGGCCGFMRINLPEGVDLAALSETLVNEYGVLILPGEQFPIGDEQKNTIQQFFRIGLGRRDFPAVLAAFEAALPRVLTGFGVDYSALSTAK